LPESVTVTFRLSIRGQPPADAAFAIESGAEGGGGAVYLCSYYGGWPVCAAEGVYRERLAFPPGTEVRYRFWRELDLNGTTEELKHGELTVGVTNQVVSQVYDFGSP
jgi:hypothetical protein